MFVAGAEVRVPRDYHSDNAGRVENWKWIRDYCERTELDPQISQINADYNKERIKKKKDRKSRGAADFADCLIKGVDI